MSGSAPGEQGNARAIGVFDSGLGGLTVVHELRRCLPRESIVYLGDTARVPYGTRSAATVVRYARGCARLLVQRNIKALVIACNTASAVALDILQAELDLPVIGVVGPGARAAVTAADQAEREQGRPVRIGVMGTLSTIRSGAYAREVARLSSRHEVHSQAAPLLVPLVEEGWLEGDVPRLAIERYLSTLLKPDVGVLVLGCTHYPLLKSMIAEVALRLLGRPIRVVDSAEATASAVHELLEQRAWHTPNPEAALQLLVTDLPDSFQASATRFLGDVVGSAQAVDIMPADG
ncbi:MAG TPA: glutamate racemase [Polyangiaceae bacterium]|nr:glutamate racemase [Polyangiaceae bacterium]